jgi:hypothetical protein
MRNRGYTVGTHKTAVYTDSDGSLCVKYHNTVVWRKHTDGRVILETGGWRTRTTMQRMNQAFWQFCNGAFYICQRKHEWYIGKRIDHVAQNPLEPFRRVVQT